MVNAINVSCLIIDGEEKNDKKWWSGHARRQQTNHYKNHPF